jgi:hypothetical protein
MRSVFIKQRFAGSWITQGVAVAAELEIADWLPPGPLTAGELARETDSNGHAIERVLRALESIW